MEEKSFAFIAVVAIVAIVGMVVLIIGGQGATTKTNPSTIILPSGEQGDVAGNAARNGRDDSVGDGGSVYNPSPTPITTDTIEDTLRLKETKTYTIGGRDYEIILVYMSDSEPYQAKFFINGEITKTLREGESATVEAGTITATNLITEKDIAEFTFTPSTGNQGPTPITTDTIEDTLRLKETKTYMMGNQEFEIGLVYMSHAEPYQAKFSINGKITIALKEGESTTVEGGTITATNLITEKDIAEFTFAHTIGPYADVRDAPVQTKHTT